MKKNYVVVCTVIVGILVPIDAFAYLDPGAGSAILQGIVGGLAAMIILLKLYWYRILRFLGFRKNPSKKEDDSGSSNKEAIKSDEE